MPLWKKFLAACLIIFGTTLFSCNTNMKGEPQIENGLTGVIARPQPKTLLGDTTLPMMETIGKPVADTAAKKKCSKIETITVEETTVGEIAPPPPIWQGTVAIVEPDKEVLKQIEPVKKDTLQKKDTTLCNTQKFY